MENDLEKLPDVCEVQKLTHFPLFIPIENKTVLVVGGGKIATRRIATLVHFACRIRVVSPTLTEQITAWVDSGRVEYEKVEYYSEALEYADIIVAATNKRLINQKVGVDAKKNSQFVSVCDCKEECNFYFPAVIAHDAVVIGLSSQGRSPSTLAALVIKLRQFLTLN